MATPRARSISTQSSSYCVRISFWLVKGRESRHHLSILNIYLRLTEEFNEGELRAVICSGQAVVLHRLAIMSKDGDWILREHDSALEHVLGVLERHGARYRYGAPLDTRWMAGAWSSHFEFRQELLRVRTDFFTRPPRISPADLALGRGLYPLRSGRISFCHWRLESHRQDQSACR